MKRSSEHQKQQMRDWYQRNKKRKLIYQREYDLKKLYNLTEKQYLALKKKQKYKCAICFEPETEEKRLHVDHSHVTGLVRGLLCNLCNKSLGMLLDSPILLGRMIGYIRTYDFYPQKTVKHLKTLSHWAKKTGKGKKTIDREMIKAQNEYVAVLTKAIRENEKKKENGTLEEFI
jgi:hypothetical protein|tara:strand:+ start:2906 stop:3427 length:522 start_codon:yes stop_codon:yes gene_type:complete